MRLFTMHWERSGQSWSSSRGYEEKRFRIHQNILYLKPWEWVRLLKKNDKNVCDRSIYEDGILNWHFQSWFGLSKGDPVLIDPSASKACFCGSSWCRVQQVLSNPAFTIILSPFTAFIPGMTVKLQGVLFCPYSASHSTTPALLLHAAPSCRKKGKVTVEFMYLHCL